ncbi:hypothetical protein LUZ62_086967 [Rhynchospora pubera]|uniref:Aminotransferase-like plant mobile domain-containing protein n=1 Tax=Rhynchospora pubera TaxID=906938 RepID=A0AAV8CDI4_9POAL|nr:hypothetical protein LUZ62_086967 [Rhynchospora pubera]
MSASDCAAPRTLLSFSIHNSRQNKKTPSGHFPVNPTVLTSSSLRFRLASQCALLSVALQLHPLCYTRTSPLSNMVRTHGGSSHGLGNGQGRERGSAHGHGDGQVRDQVAQSEPEGTLLTMNARHASNRAYSDPDWLYRPRSRRMTFRYHERILPILQQYGLEHIARVAELSIDHSLITMLVERWRRETHSFHLPTGEFTVTLQDVSCLWGLPINGAPVIGISDDHWEDDVLSAFGRDEAWAAFRRPPGTFHMRMGWLREPWVPPTTRDREYFAAELPEDANEEQVLYFALRDRRYIVGHQLAVLAFLYRGLCRASGSSREIAAPLILLQMWSWTRFPVGRPIRHDFGAVGLGGAPYGLFWLIPHDFIDTARYNISTYRREFEELVDNDVNWTPYDGIMDELPEICRNEQEQRLWYYEGPLIWFWIVEMYTPQRVMRQFGRSQLVPPPQLPGAFDFFTDAFDFFILKVRLILI